jgi:hypothetical protein
MDNYPLPGRDFVGEYNEKFKKNQIMKIKPLTKFLIAILPADVTGITLAPFGIYIKQSHLIYPELINHEKIHWKQQMEMLIIFFYAWYMIEWVIKLLINRKTAYRSISFEQEAYYFDTNLSYSKFRKHYSWIKYIFKCTK